MGKGKGLTFTLFAALGALAGYATYMINKNEFSEETKDRYSKVLNKIKNVGTDISRTYTSIGDKESFTNNTKNLGNSTMKLAEKTGNLVTSASKDIYESAKSKIVKIIDSIKDDDNAGFDDLDESYLKKRNKKRNVVHKSKANSKKTNKKSK